MTVKLTWTHLFAALGALALIIGGAMWAIRNANQASLADAERLVRIAELEDQIDNLKDEADSAKADADEARDERQSTLTELDRYRAAAKHQKDNPEVVPLREEVETLRGYAATLETHLKLANKETIDPRRSLTLLTMALESSQERNVLQEKRYTALKRDKKKAKRRRIFGDIGVALGGIGVGIGIGKAS